MKITHTNVRATKITLRDNGLEKSNFKINPQFYKKIVGVTDSTYKVTLIVKIENTEEFPFPVDLEVVFEAQFKIQECTEQETNNFLNIGAIQMIFPFIRASINSVVTAALMPPLVLPIIDVRQFQDIEEK